MWADIWATLFNLNTVDAAIRLSTPIALAALAGAFSERAGVVNIGLEGMLLSGAFAAVLGSFLSGNAWLGVLCGVLVGALLGALLALFTIRLEADHVVSGVGLNILSLGLTTWLMQVIWGSRGTSPSVAGIGRMQLPWLSELPLLGRLLGAQSPFVYLMLLLVLASWWLMFKTPWGLRLRVIGEHPEAADSLGINISAIKYSCVIGAGALCGLGGAYLSLGNLTWFSVNMSAGRGYMALAANIFGQWNPLGGFAASLLFSFADAVQMRLQGLDIAVAHHLIQMLPYLLTIAVLAGAVLRSRPPAALGRHYRVQR